MLPGFSVFSCIGVDSVLSPFSVISGSVDLSRR